MPSNILNVTISNTQNIPIIIGSSSSFDINIKNTSQTSRLYNISIFLTLPDGLTLSNATLTQTSSQTNGDNSNTYSWINLKDLAPMEEPYKFSITVKCNSKFKNGSSIPFGYNFSGINVTCQVDTMPRGIYDIGNEVIKELVSMTYTTVRFTSSISTSGKVLKGAGTSLFLNDYTQQTIATCKFSNNSISKSLVNISILLDDGIRYIGSVVTSGTDASQVSNPTISVVKINDKIYTQLYFGNVLLSTGSNTTLTFTYAVWNKTNNNSGNPIPHGTSLNMYVNMNSADPLVTSSSNSSTSFLAMDLIITTSISKTIVDVQMAVTYTYIFRVGQYYNIKDIVVNYLLPDGILYLTSSTLPVSVIHNSSFNGYYLTYNFSRATQNSTNTININAKMDSYYSYKLDSNYMNLPLVASDPFLAITNILGTLIETPSEVTDSSSVISSIGLASITKQFVKGYYKNGTAKTISSLAPGDLAEYNLIYNASLLKAKQKAIYISDFFPLSADPIDKLNYIYSGVTPVTTPKLISPHGVDFYYGDINGLSSSTINFKVPIATLGSSTQNANLMKLKGLNTYGVAYSSRAQVNFNIGIPNLTLTKTVTGPNKTAIQAKEVYIYEVTIRNTNNGNETDAFDFTLSDKYHQTWCTLDTNSITATGSGKFKSPVVQDNTVNVYITKLAPGEFVTLRYRVTLSSQLAPGVNIITTASNTNPYSQVYDPNSENYQYNNLSKSASVTLNSRVILISKTNYAGSFKVGSPITYTIVATVPQGTICYGLYLKDVLPSGGQSYLGPSYKNNTPITPVLSSNNITFPSEGTVDARISPKVLTYTFTAKITNATKIINTISSTQNNTAYCYYQQTPTSNFLSVNNSLTVTVNHPNILLSLSATDKSTGISYTSNAPISTTSQVQFTLIFKNNSAINLSNGTIEIPLSNNFILLSLDTNVLCTSAYNSALNKIIITIPSLSPSTSGFMTFTASPQSSLRAGTSIKTQATAVSYYNDITTTKIYGGEQSNDVYCILPPGVSLKPNPLLKISESSAFIVTHPGETVAILNYFKNTGGGYDDFTIKGAPVSIPYTIFIDDILISYVPSDTQYVSSPTLMSSLAPNVSKIIKLITTIPSNISIGYRFDFVITAKSKTSPYPESTVYNIDPNSF